MSVRYSLLLTALALVWPALAAAQPASLFQSEPAQRLALSDPQLAILEHLEASPRTVSMQVGRVATEAFSAEELQVALPDGSQLVLARGEKTHRAPGDYSWMGTGNGLLSYGLFVVREGRVTGTLRTDEGTYAIHPVGDGLHALVAVDETAIPEHPEDWEDFQAAASSQEELLLDPAPRPLAEADAPEGPPVIRVLVAYTASSAHLVGDIEGLIQLAIDETNYTYRMSGVHHRVILAHTYQTDTLESDKISTDLGRFRTNGNGYFDEAWLTGYEYGADLFMLIGEYTDACGIAYLWADGRSTAYSVVNRSCAVGQYTTAHEIGHNLGAQHNQEDGSNSFFPHGYGSRDLDAGWRTVMAYSTTNCVNARCLRIPFYSTPDISFNGIPLGDATSRDNVRVLNDTAPQIAGYALIPGHSAASVGPSAINVTLPPGESAVVSVQVESVGEVPLRWQASVAGTPGGVTEPADGFGYTWGDSRHEDGPAFDFIDIADEGTPIDPATLTTNCSAGPLSAGLTSIALPFAFPFYDGVHTSVRVAVNGFLTFDTDFTGCSTTPAAIPTAEPPAGLIAPLWMNLSIETQGGIYTRDLGDGRFVVQWNAPRVEESVDRIFQAILYESGDIRFHYAVPGPFTVVRDGTTFGLRNTVGIESPEGHGIEIQHNTSSIHYLHSGLALHFTPPARWLSLGRPQGSLDVGQSTSFDVRLDAEGLEPGSYEAEVRVRTNDGRGPVHTIPVYMTVAAVSNAPEAVAEAAILQGIFPNPVSAGTTVEYALPRSATVRLAVYDVIGRRVALLAEGQQAAGQHSVRWDASGAASGVYLVRLEADGTASTVRITVLR